MKAIRPPVSRSQPSWTGCSRSDREPVGAPRGGTRPTETGPVIEGARSFEIRLPSLVLAAKKRKSRKKDGAAELLSFIHRWAAGFPQMGTRPRHDSLSPPCLLLHLCHLWIKIPSPDRKRAGPVLAAKKRPRSREHDRPLSFSQKVTKATKVTKGDGQERRVFFPISSSLPSLSSVKVRRLFRFGRGWAR